jgi:hypothetical protein
VSSSCVDIVDIISIAITDVAVVVVIVDTSKTLSSIVRERL